MSIFTNLLLPKWVTVPLAFLRSVPLWAYAGAGLLVAFGIFRHHYIAVGVEREHGKTVKVQAAFDVYKAAAKKAADQARADAKAKEAMQAASFSAIAEQLKKDKNHALQTRNAAITSLRNGTLRLRDEWTCPANGYLPEAASGSGLRNAAIELREKSAGDLVQVGADADAAVTACQAILRAERQ